MRTLLAFRDSGRGATAIEYGLIAAMIGTAIIGALTVTGTSLGGQWDSWTANFAAAVGL